LINPFLAVPSISLWKRGSFIQDSHSSPSSRNLTREGFRVWLRSKLTVWRGALLVFLVVYCFALLINLGYMSIQWDEIPHLYGGLLLFRGQTQNYLSVYGYYPPLYDLLTVGFYQAFGVNVAVGRSVAVIFSLLSVWITFEFANRMYGPKTGLIAAVLLGAMPGFFWVSRMTMIETMLVFFFSLSLLFFFSWIRSRNDKALVLSGLAFGFGMLAKYQIVVAGIVMLVGIIFFFRGKIRPNLKKLLIVPIIAILVVAPWFLVLAQSNPAAIGGYFYSVGVGGEDRSQYSTRFPLPVFYLVEMTWPFNDIPVHPISLPIYILGLLGLGVMAYRRKREDKFLLAWFLVVYVFFSLVPNKQWRYVTPLFPVLAVSAAGFILLVYSRLASFGRAKQLSLRKLYLSKVAAAFFVVLAASSIIYSGYNAYQMTARDQIHIPMEETANYIASHMSQNESAVIVGAFNLLNQDMLRFYLPANMSPDQIWQYPDLPVDAFTPNFNITEFVSLCEQRNVRYLVLYDFGANTPFFNTTMTYSNVTQLILDSGKFGYTGDEPFFGDELNYRTFLVGFRQAYNLEPLNNSSLGL